MGLKSNDKRPHERHTEARAMQPQAKDRLGLPEVGRGQEGFSPCAFGESMVFC